LTTATLILLGLSASFSAAIFAHARSLFPDRYVGRVITAINLCTWGGVFVIQMVTGLIVNAFPADAAGRSPQAAYQVLFAVLAVALIIALLFYRRIADVPPSRDMGEG
jgi:MFS family permease